MQKWYKRYARKFGIKKKKKLSLLLQYAPAITLVVDLFALPKKDTLKS